MPKRFKIVNDFAFFYDIRKKFVIDFAFFSFPIECSIIFGYINHHSVSEDCKTLLISINIKVETMQKYAKTNKSKFFIAV